jgi:hypothetical protein
VQFAIKGANAVAAVYFAVAGHAGVMSVTDHLDREMARRRLPPRTRRLDPRYRAPKGISMSDSSPGSSRAPAVRDAPAEPIRDTTALDVREATADQLAAEMMLVETSILLTDRRDPTMEDLIRLELRVRTEIHRRGIMSMRGIESD